ncbi:MAG: hypothetical protein ACJ8NS_05370 [Chthoniobacterales bacterium]|jgi:hypothetical protein
MIASHPIMRPSPILAIALAATFVVSAEFVVAQQRPSSSPTGTPRKNMQRFMPDSGREQTGPADKPSPSQVDPAKLLAIIERQETLIKALRARIKELELANKALASPTASPAADNND